MPGTILSSDPGNSIPDPNNAPNHPKPLSPGTKIGEHGEYCLVKELGKGGFGVTWQAEKTSGGVKQIVVCKLLKEEHRNNKKATEEVRRVFKLTNSLNHQYICPLIGIETDPVYGIFLVMEYAEGKTLREWFNAQPNHQNGLPLSEILPILKKVADALDVIHYAKVFHRDVKPENIIFRKQNEITHPWLIDFGIAAQIHTEGAETVTEHGQARNGTPAYMAPEQFDAKLQDGRTDQYALAVIAYEFLTGQRPFRGGNATTIAKAQMLSLPKHQNLGDATYNVLCRALNKEKWKRFKTCGEFLAELENPTSLETEEIPFDDFLEEIRQEISKREELEKNIIAMFKDYFEAIEGVIDEQKNVKEENLRNGKWENSQEIQDIEREIKECRDRMLDFSSKELPKTPENWERVLNWEDVSKGTAAFQTFAASIDAPVKSAAPHSKKKQGAGPIGAWFVGCWFAFVLLIVAVFVGWHKKGDASQWLSDMIRNGTTTITDFVKGIGTEPETEPETETETETETDPGTGTVLPPSDPYAELKTELDGLGLKYSINPRLKMVMVTGYAGEAETLTIPDGVTHIKENAFAFEGNTSFRSVTIPASVTSIGKWAFRGTADLKEFVVSAENKNYKSVDGILFSKDGSWLIQVPAGSERTVYIIPDGVKKIGSSAFCKCTALTSVRISFTVDEIREFAFFGCTELEEVTLPASVKSIGNSAFAECAKLKDLRIPSSVTSLGDSAFEGCTNLLSVQIPSSVTSIGDSACAGCTSLTSVQIPSSVTSIGDSVCAGCTSLTSVQIPSSVTSIGDSAFEGCTNLLSVQIPSSVTSIGNSAFAGCTSLSSVQIPSSVTSIGILAFARCGNLTSVTIPASVSMIGNDAFSDCPHLTIFGTKGSAAEMYANSNGHHFQDMNDSGKRMVKTVDGIEYAFRWCPPGTFLMGSPEDEPGRYDNETQHSVTLTRGFWMLETEVTQAMWQSVMGTDPSHFKGAQNPVECVSWTECDEFCDKLSSKLGLTLSLPTEEQWEYACRAGTTTAYSFGSSLNGQEANCNGNYPCGTSTKGPYLEKTVPVKSYAPNAWGLYDMHGNVMEWCQDWYDSDYYAESPMSDPTGPSSGPYRVFRGGSWSDYAQGCRSSCRNGDTLGNGNTGLGFRVVLASPASEE